MNIIKFSRRLTIISYFALLIVLLIWYGLLFPSPLILGMLILPLVFPLRGLTRGDPYTHAWSSFLILIYFIHGVVEAYANPSARSLALLEIFFSLGFYTGAVIYARTRGRALK